MCICEYQGYPLINWKKSNITPLPNTKYNCAVLLLGQMIGYLCILPNISALLEICGYQGILQ